MTLAVDETNTIIEGHGRLQAAIELEMNMVPVIILSHMTPTQKKAYILAHNKLTMNSSFDFDILKEELNSLKEDGFDAMLAGFSTEEIDTITEDTSDIDLDDFFKDIDTNTTLRKKKKTYICPHCNKSFEA